MTEGPAQTRLIVFEVEPGQMNEFLKRQSQAMAIRKRLGFADLPGDLRRTQHEFRLDRDRTP